MSEPREAAPRPRLGHPVLAPAWTVLILALCSIPGSELPEVKIVAADKLAHLLLFVVFALLWSWRKPLVGTAAVLLGGLALAVISELYQGWIGLGRIPDPFDAVANSAGLLLGLILFRRPKRRLKAQ